MKSLLCALALLLSGCAATIRSDVTTFHDWPQAPAEKTYAFDMRETSLEMRSYQNLVRAELAKLGFQESSTPKLKVGMTLTIVDQPVQVLRIADPWFYAGRAGVWYPGRFHHPYFHSPFYSPYWYGLPPYEESLQHYYQRDLNLSIRAAGDGKRLFDVTVHNSSRKESTPTLMPALVASAFAGFPGPNGAARRIDIRQEGD